MANCTGHFVYKSFFFLILSFHLLLGTFSVNGAILQGSEPHKFDQVKLLGFALQGNGGNYAATLSAIAESLDIQASRAMVQSQNEGLRIGFMFPSFVGASSGSLVVAVASSLVKNEHLFPPAEKDRVFMPTEVHTLARALRYIAFVADESFFERVMFITKSGLSMLRGKLGIDHLSYQFGRLFYPAEHPNWWSQSIARSEAVLYDFTKVIFLAQNLTREMLLEDLGNVSLSMKHRSLAHKLSWLYVSDLPTYEAGPDNPEGAMELAAKVAKYVRSRAEDRVREVIVQHKYFPLLRHTINYGDPTRNRHHPLKQAVLNHELAEGFVTATFVLWKKELKESDVAGLPNYLDPDLRPMLFASPETAENLQQFYNGSKFSGEEKNVLIAAARHIHGALLPSTKEPDLLEVHAGYAQDEQKYSLEWIYDIDTKRQYPLHPQQAPKLWIGTLGGFINAASMARLAALQLYIKVKKLKDPNRSGPEYQSHLIIVGKPRLPSIVDFAQKKIVELFSQDDPLKANKNMEAVEEHASYDIERTIEYMEKSKQIGVPASAERLGVYWDISGTIPAAQAGKSYQLVYLIANEVRKQLDDGRCMTFNPLDHEELEKFTTRPGYKYDLHGSLVGIE